jgi:hypothetical protein
MARILNWALNQYWVKSRYRRLTGGPCQETARIPLASGGQMCPKCMWVWL